MFDTIRPVRFCYIKIKLLHFTCILLDSKSSSKLSQMELAFLGISAAAGAVSAASGFAGLGAWVYNEYGRNNKNLLRSFAALDYNVKFMVQVENYTKFHLQPAESETEWGHISEPPEAMFGGEKHGVFGHKIGHTATGCSGVLR